MRDVFCGQRGKCMVIKASNEFNFSPYTYIPNISIVFCCVLSANRNPPYYVHVHLLQELMSLLTISVTKTGRTNLVSS